MVPQGHTQRTSKTLPQELPKGWNKENHLKKHYGETFAQSHSGKECVSRSRHLHFKKGCFQ